MICCYFFPQEKLFEELLSAKQTINETRAEVASFRTKNQHMEK